MVASGQFHLIFFFFNFYLFICVWLCWVFIAVEGLFPVVMSRGHSLVAVLGLLTAGASCVAEHRLSARGFYTCGTQAYLPWGTWNLPRQGTEPVSPVLSGKFLTTGPPKGSPYLLLIKRGVTIVWWHIIHLYMCPLLCYRPYWTYFGIQLL